MIIFQPSGRRGQVPLGISIVEASRRLGVDMDNPAAHIFILPNKAGFVGGDNVQYMELTLEENFQWQLMETIHLPHMAEDFSHLQGVL